MPSDPSITPNAGPSQGSTGHQGHAEGSNEGLALPGADRPAEARSADSGLGQGWLARLVVAPVTLNAPATSPAAPVPAAQRPEVAGEPESGQDGTAGREELRALIDAAIRPTMLFGLRDAELDGPGGKQRIGEWADWIAEAVLAVRDRRMEQLAAGRETWKAKAAEIERDRDRLAADKLALQGAVRLLMRSDREQTQRADAAEASVRASRYVADYWRSALSGQGNAAAAHALAMVGAALDGERAPNELGLAADEHAAFRAAITEEPSP